MKEGISSTQNVIGCDREGWEVLQERFHQISISDVPYNLEGTLSIHPTSAVQELVSVLRLESGPSKKCFLH